ncbi:MAG: cytochrome c-type biogenesis CcmF C-terminal domain-containing protein, partial [Marinobacter sp.]|uniref:cytochrome c-type biogenesis CcmF C-terminal domain-containing protein n=1 Tax=Marinobacter sp. TaxID=50741 RepID=UPI00299D3ABC
GEEVGRLYPEKRQYLVQRNIMTEAGIDAGLFRDLFVAVGEQVGDNAWAMRIQYKPLVRWLWLGALFMAAGGFLAIADRRYRIKDKQPARAPAAQPEPMAGKASEASA